MKSITAWDYFQYRHKYQQRYRKGSLNLNNDHSSEISWPILSGLYEPHHWLLPGTITQICGAPDSGKTQLCILVAISVLLPLDMGGMNGNVILVDTNGGITIDRLLSLLSPLVSDVSDILSRIFIIKVTNINELINQLEYIYQDFLPNNHSIRLLCIDSLAFLLRQIPTSDHYPTRYQQSDICLQRLNAICTRYGLIVAVTNHFVYHRDDYSDTLVPFYLGHGWNTQDQILISWNSDSKTRRADLIIFQESQSLSIHASSSNWIIP